MANLTYATSAQINEIERLGSDRNARRILYEMESDHLIGSIRREQKIYYVRHRGGELIGKNNPRLKRSEIDHSIMRNEAQAILGFPWDWQKEVPIRKNDEIFIIADAAFTGGNNIYFVEIDIRASMRTNNAKIKKYAEIFELIEQPATLVWHTLIDARKSRLAESCEKAGINFRILEGGAYQ